MEYSGADGSYMCENIPVGEYTITGEKVGNWGGANSTDALLMQRHFISAQLITDALVLKAADVNVSGTINSTDALLAQRRFIGAINTFSAGDWTFLNYSRSITSSNITQDINGLAVGDVNGSYTPGMALPNTVVSAERNVPKKGELGRISKLEQHGMPHSSSIDTVVIRIDTTVATPGQQVNVAMTVQKFSGISAISLVVVFDTSVATFQGLLNAPSGTLANAIAGKVSISWFSTVPTTIADGGKLLDLQFNYKKGTSDFRFETQDCEIADSVGSPKLVSYRNGVIKKLDVPGIPMLVLPGNGSVKQPTTTTFRWIKAGAANMYHMQLANDSNFVASLVVNDSTITDTLRIVSNLGNSKKYFWRIRGKNNSGLSDWATKFSFATIGLPTLALSSSAIDFGKTKLGVWTDTVVTITNGGTDTLKLSSVKSTKSCFTMRPLLAVIAPGLSKSDTIRFTVDSIGVRKGMLLFGSNTSKGMDTIAVTGFGFGTPILSFNKTPINFGSVMTGKSKDTSFAISNIGSDTLKIISINSGKATFAVRPLVFLIPPGESRRDTISFKPSIAGKDSTIIIITGNSLITHDTLKVIATATIMGIAQFVGLPVEYSIAQNYPNPFNPSTTIVYGLPSRSYVRLEIYNVLGQVVQELVNTEQQAGYQYVVWNAAAASGLYFYRIDATSIENPKHRFVSIKKMMQLK